MKLLLSLIHANTYFTHCANINNFISVKVRLKTYVFIIEHVLSTRLKSSVVSICQYRRLKISDGSEVFTCEEKDGIVKKLQ